MTELLEHQLSKSKKEVDRLQNNWRAFLDILPEMVILVNHNKSIEYMNPKALDVLGNLCGQECLDYLCQPHRNCEDDCFLQKTKNGVVSDKLQESKIGEVDVEYCFVGFEGYTGDRLVMLSLRDITEKKRYQAELETFHKNITEILNAKINQLKQNEEIKNQLNTKVDFLTSYMKYLLNPGKMLGTSKAMEAVRNTVFQVADTEATVLITGESGTGKELVADLIQKTSSRREKPFLKINCSSISESLLESDLFGYEKGAFTGATETRKGKFEIVEDGTIFLDEIGDVSPRVQVALLRVFQNREIIRVGGSKPIKIEARIITATNKDLAQEVEEGRFRLDLFYRLNIIKIHPPPLRSRTEDIPLLAHYFIKKYQKTFKKGGTYHIQDSVLKLFSTYEWPGNVRELQNVLQRAILMSTNNIIAEKDVSFDANIQAAGQRDNFDLLEQSNNKTLKEALSGYEAMLLQSHLDNNHGDVQKTAKVLGTSKTSLYNKIKKHNLILNC